MQNNRTYIFLDNLTNREKECNEQSAISILNLRQYINGQARFQFVRSFIPQVTKTKKITRKGRDANNNLVTQKWDKIDQYKETDVSTIPPKLHRTMGPQGLITKLETTWLQPMSAAELAEAPDKIKNR